MLELRLLDEIVAPFLVDRGSLEDLRELLEESVVLHLMDEAKLSHQEIATRLQRDRSTIYEIATRGRKRREKAGGLSQEDLWYNTLKFLVKSHPHYKSVGEISDHTGAPSQKLVHLLAAMHKLGEIEEAGGKYRASSMNMGRQPNLSDEWILNALLTTYRLARRRSRGEAGILFRMVEHSLEVLAAEESVRSIDVGTRAAIVEGVTKSTERDPDGLAKKKQIRGLICLSNDEE